MQLFKNLFLLFSLFIFMFLVLPSASADLTDIFSRWELRNTLSSEIDLPGGDVEGNYKNRPLYLADSLEDTYLKNRLTLRNYLAIPIFNETVYADVFGEARRDTETEHWDRSLVGIGMGANLLSWVEAGIETHYTWLTPGDDFYEIMPHLRLQVPLPIPMPMFDFYFYALEEYVYDLENDYAEKNTIGAGLGAEFTEHLEGTVGWRHRDIVHGNDTDFLEISLTLKI